MYIACSSKNDRGILSGGKIANAIQTHSDYISAYQIKVRIAIFGETSLIRAGKGIDGFLAPAMTHCLIVIE